jgi:hypothetical protein
MQSPLQLSCVLAAGLSAASVGCAGTVAGTADTADAETLTTSAIVVISRTSDASKGSSAEASARFIRVAAPTSTQDALRAIGAALEVPARGSCASVATLAASPTAPMPAIELLDVGMVSLEAGGMQTRLLPRQLPDVTDVVSGVVYARATEPSLLPAATPYVVHVSGAADLTPVDLTATAPSDPSEVRIAGEDAGGVVVASGPWVTFSWTPEAADGLLYVDVRPNGIRCAFEDVGVAAISSLYFSSEGTLVVHRVHRERLRAPGIDATEVRFDFARTVPYARAGR